jgi:pimeloyl-ACP methyl ester carboxylesterase
MVAAKHHQREKRAMAGTTTHDSVVTSASRRTLLMAAAGAAGLATAGAMGAGLAQAQSKGRTFVLIHGAWHGGWCWQPVADILRAKGHKVYAPSLTGLADRSHLLSTSITLDTHIADIVNLFKWEDIEDACLVGHSYGGWPVSGATEQLAGKISSIVYLDAFMPENGQKGMELSSAQFQEQLKTAIAKGEAGRPVPKAEAFKVLDPKNVAWVQAKMTPQPTVLSTTPIVQTGARDRIAKKTYIRAHAYGQPNFDKALAKCKADTSWRTIELTPDQSGHDVMVDMPARLAEILMEVA